MDVRVEGTPTPLVLDDFYMVASRAWWRPTPNKILPLEESSSMNVDLFYEIFQKPGLHADCLETSVNLWVDNRN